jgi:hypothetical protein
VKRFYFWQQWLFYSSLVFALFGVVFAVWGNNPIFKYYNSGLAKIFWSSNSIPQPAEEFRRFIWAPLGGTIACCYILLAYIAYFPFRRRERWAWWAAAVAYTVWIILDSGACLYYGVYFQVWLINGFSFLVKALPLAFTYSNFFRKAEKIS